MAVSSSPPRAPSAGTGHRSPGLLHALDRATLPLRAAARAAIFFLKVFPMLPSGPVDWVTEPPVVQKVRYPARSGHAEGDLYRPPGDGPHPGILVCLGVVPFGVDHPQVPVLGNALARAGFAALLYWSPHMRDFCIDPEDIENISLAYRWLIEQPGVDPARSGLLGTCVGGSFALMAAASPLVRDRVAFVSAYAPFSSLWTFARDVASATTSGDEGRRPWRVDQLTRKVFVHSVTSGLEPEEAARIRAAFAGERRDFDARGLSAQGQQVVSLLSAASVDDAEAVLQRLPLPMRERLDALSPINYLRDIHAPLILLLHDRGDQVIPVGESRRLCSALGARAGLHYTEMQFQHLDPVKGHPPWYRLVGELGKFFLAVLPMFRQAVAA
jgi:dipeptidyl aminopeptidase/acylaminoacyl peptidase